VFARDVRGEGVEQGRDLLLTSPGSIKVRAA
jgi:hypothetical protein